MLRKIRACVLVAMWPVAVVVHAGTSTAQDWSPFDPFAQTRPKSKQPPPPPADGRPPLAPMDGSAGLSDPSSPARPAQGYGADRDDVVTRQDMPTGPPPETERGVERGELTPVMSSDGSGLPMEVWQGLTLEQIGKNIGEVQIPPRSPALHALWRRLLTTSGPGPHGNNSPGKFVGLKLEALFLSGLLVEASKELAAAGSLNDPLLLAIQARMTAALGDRDTACPAAQGAIGPGLDIPKVMKADAILVSGYCAVASGDKASAGLSAELAREEGMPASPGLDALDSFSIGRQPRVGKGVRLSVIDYRIVSAAGGKIDEASLLSQADPPLLAAVALNAASEPGLRLAAAEAAARLNAISGETLGAAYRTQTAARPVDQTAPPTLGHSATHLAGRRAGLFAAIEAEQDPANKARLIRSFVDDARRNGLYLQALVLAAGAAGDLEPVADVGWFAETGIEMELAAGNYERARRWAAFAPMINQHRGSSLEHWLALIDIADPAMPSGRGSALGSVEELASAGAFKPELLHRLATVLDALDYNVPIPLWEAASRTPQPAGGHLPATGILTELQEASKQQQFGRTVFLVMRALGGDGAEGAHMIALGDSIRALKRAGLEADARRLGFEALFSGWPRSATTLTTGARE